jgi:3-oxoacyl-[acyl-carrier-protein] synthase II
VSRPFDRRRDGFVLGEGAAMAVLSCRPAAIELTGTARTLDAHHITAPAPDGGGAIRAMRLALADAGRQSVDVVQAHGTSTPLNDAVEASALHTVFGERLEAARVSSVKGALGHTIAAAGALGFLAGVDAVATGTVLPTAGLQEPDGDCALPHVLGRAVTMRVESALVNAFAFGGANCSLVLARAG